MFESLAAWLVLPLGIAFGWYLRGRGTDTESYAHLPSADAMAGMAHLVNDDPDQAVAALLRATELDSQAIELHLTLGTLFRKRGEVDRALRVHEALAERGQLKPEQRERTRHELALDYLKAGITDRAEALFEQLSQQGLYVTSALESQISIHEQSHEWRHAIDTSRRLQAVAAVPRQVMTAQYYCELAEESLRAKDLAEALRLSRRSLEEDQGCVRGNLLQGRILEQTGDLQGAIKVLKRVPEQDLRFMPETIGPLMRCSRAAGELPAFLDFLRELDTEISVNASVQAQAQLMVDAGMNPTRLLAEAFAANPSWGLLEQLLQTLEPPDDEAMAQAIETLRNALGTAAAARARYRCTSCGLAPGLLFWQCPSCKQWATVVPADDRLSPPVAA